MKFEAHNDPLAFFRGVINGLAATIVLLGVAALFWAICLTVGCASSGGGGTPAPAVTPERTNVLRRAVVAGLTLVNAAAYNGWNGHCPGCDVDADVFALLCREQGIEVSLHHNSQATRARLVAAARAQWRGMVAGDLWVFYVSGHGGQIPDASGDEEDGMDETLCLWDGQMDDDALRSLWDEMPAGVRVLFVSDTCHSGTNFKGLPYRPSNLSLKVSRGYRGALIHFGGCADGASSYGSAQGGVFTTALIDAWGNGVGYRTWFDRAAALMPRNQTPVYAEYGAVDEGFRQRRALE